MRRFVLLIVLGASVISTAACSYVTDFVIVNESDAPVIVRYEATDGPGTFVPSVTPAVVPAADLSEDGQQWTPIEFQVDEASRAVITRLNPGQALRIATMNHYSGHNYPNDAYKYQIRRITVSGNRGELDLAGDQARTSFTEVARTLYTLTYK
ncbi:MAG TPA: hypothetical protein VLB87_16015 [Pyrinomonadaceae bacterium]|nr:hypothetical protein [Pyrinomonadaceae bacterium]